MSLLSRAPPPPLPPAAAEQCWHDGQMRPLADARLSAVSLTARYGIGVFEGVRLYLQGGDGGALLPLALGAHLRRLARSVRDAGLPKGVLRQVPEAIVQVLAHSPAAKDAYLRIAITAGNSGPMTCAAEPCLTVSLSFPARRPTPPAGSGLRVLISPWQKVSPRAMPAHIKAIGSYAAGYAALHRARAAGADSCILRADDRSLCEAPSAALFVVKDGVVITPPLSCGCLPSITRRIVLGLCDQLKLPHRRRRLWPVDLRGADEAFVAGTAIELAAIGSVGLRPLPPAQPLLARLAAAFVEVCRGQRELAGGLGVQPLPPAWTGLPAAPQRAPRGPGLEP